MTTQHSKLYGVSLGIDFPKAFVRGLLQRFADKDPHALARAHVIVNSARMMRRIRQEFIRSNATLHPKFHLVTDVTTLCGNFEKTSPKSSLALRLELVQLVTRLIQEQPDLAARSSVYALSDSLANLIDEVQSEGVDPAVIEALDVSDQSGHWARAKRFFALIRTYLDTLDTVPDTQSFLRDQIEFLATKWFKNPLLDPVFIAGSTGSRGTTMDLMAAVSRLPNGAVILPGLDRNMTAETWAQFSDRLQGQDHPQYRLAKVAAIFGMEPMTIPEWSDMTPINAGRNALLSLALLPAPVTDTWRKNGPLLPDLMHATQEITMLNAPNKRLEALAIAVKMREAVETGENVALITPDRQLTRQVTAALDKWDILPDDSAGMPLQLSPPGRFLRQVAGVISRPMTAASLLALLKHPITNSGDTRGDHLLLTRELELYLRKQGIPFPTQAILEKWCITIQHDQAPVWAHWVIDAILKAERSGISDFASWVEHHRTTATHIAAGPSLSDDAGQLWQKKAGAQVRTLFTTMQDAAHAAAPLDVRDYVDIFSGILAKDEVRDFKQPHPNITILGTLEARVQAADTIILASLNEDTWPAPPSPDPWLNRKMRADAGLLLPERQVGLSAHDFQTAFTLGTQVWITRSMRSDDAETVPSRWINRLSNLLNGLDKTGGPEAIEDMQARGNAWLNLASAFDHAPSIAAARRPSVAPPLSARPKELSVTEIKTLIRDPYSIHAKRVLRIRSLDSLDQTPDARLRGIIIHEVMEEFCKRWDEFQADQRANALIRLTREKLAERAPWAVTQLFWQSRMMQIAEWFVARETEWRIIATPMNYEVKGRLNFPDLDFTLTAIADRIDAHSDGIALYDYKTGKPPSTDQQLYFDKQLYLLSMIAEDGGFDGLDPAAVVIAAFIGLGSSPKEEPMPIAKEDIATARDGFRKLISAYSDPDSGYTARRALFKTEDFSEYDQLSRFGEWDITDDPQKDHLT